MKLGIDSYSFHRFFGETTRWEIASEVQWSLIDFLEFVAGTTLTVASLQTCYLGDPKDFDVAMVNSWRKQTGKEIVFTWGHPAGLNGGKNVDALDDAIDFLKLAKQLEISQMRIVLGNHYNFDEDTDFRKNLLKPMISELLIHAAKYNILISIENHADFPTQVLYDLISEIDHPLLGMCFDFANCLRVGESPIKFLRKNDLSKIFMVHVKDVKKLPGEASPVGWWPTVDWGTGDVGTKECLQYLLDEKFAYLLLVELSNLFHGLDEISVAKRAIVFLEDQVREKM